MPCNIKNPASIDLRSLGPHVQGMYDHFDQKFAFKKPPTMVFDSDPQNKANILGKTAYYDPDSMEIHIYTDGRHPKDMLRSIAHELIHHRQNLEGRLDVGGYHGEGYYLENKELQKLEHEAMLEGNAVMREYEDTIKKENNQMSLKEWKNNELNKLLLKKFGILKENKKEYDLEENQDRVFAPSHYCAHHVVHEGKQGVTVDHNWNESLQKVTKYDVKFEDGTIIRNIDESQLTIVEGMTHGGKRDDHPKVKKDKEELEELTSITIPDAKRDDELDEIRPYKKRDDKELEEEKKNMVKGPDGKMVPDYAVDGKGENDKADQMSKGDDDEDSDKEESGEKESDKGLSKVPPQLRKHVKGKMKKENKVNLKQLIEKVLKNNEKIMKNLKDK